MEHITDYAEFELFCNDLMSREGYKEIQPLGGFKDKGRDAIHRGKNNNVTTIFSYSVRGDWEDKLFEDLGKILAYKHSCDRVTFVTTGIVSPTKQDTLKKDVKAKYYWDLEIFDLERIATLIDNHYADLKQRHSSIFTFSLQLTESQSTSSLDAGLYADYLMQAYHEWLEKYTPLLAEHREIETIVFTPRSSLVNYKEIPVAKIPEFAPLAILLGESGAGKTTALWRIVVECSKALREDKSKKVPILISLRGWGIEHRCRELVQDEFRLIGSDYDAIEKELRAGNCLVLFDGLNELPPAEKLRDRAYNDIQHFLVPCLKSNPTV